MALDDHNLRDEQDIMEVYFIHFKKADKSFHILPIRAPDAQAAVNWLRAEYEGCYVCTVHLGVIQKTGSDWQ